MRSSGAADWTVLINRLINYVRVYFWWRDTKSRKRGGRIVKRWKVAGEVMLVIKPNAGVTLSSTVEEAGAGQ